jgi:2-polyprenyl-3-methyl-5-hydroxy-6-metoxy-1,4-benzoquinol methylase
VALTPWTNERAIREWSEVPREVLTAMDPCGDFARERLLNPVIFRMLGEVSGQRVLDAGCGQGYLSRLLVARGAQVVGVEPGSALFEYAVEMERERSPRIRYVKEDLSKLSDLGIFDAVVANMVFVDIPDWRAAMRRCVESLRPGGLFVFSLNHPCFEDLSNSWLANGSLLVSEYLREYVVGVRYGANFHRPLSDYVNYVLDLGCQVVELSEPGLDETATVGGPDGAEAWVHVPPFIIVAARRK